MPMMKRVGRTVFGVSMGCHALRRCCLKAVSWVGKIQSVREGRGVAAVRKTGRGRWCGQLTCRLSPATLLLLALAILVLAVCAVTALVLPPEEGHLDGRCRWGRTDMSWVLCPASPVLAVTKQQPQECITKEYY
jgi:hypothetical protein